MTLNIVPNLGLSETFTGVLTGPNQNIDVVVAGYNSVGIRLTGTWSGGNNNILFQCSFDGITFHNLEMYSTGGLARRNAATSANFFHAPIGGIKVVRVRAPSNTTTVNCTVDIIATMGPCRTTEATPAAPDTVGLPSGGYPILIATGHAATDSIVFPWGYDLNTSEVETPDTGDTTQEWVLGVNLRRSTSTGSVEIGTTTNPIIATTASGSVVDTELPAAAALADGAANPTTPTVGAAPLMFNGTTWDRQRGNITNGLDVDVTRVQGTVTVDSELPAAAVLGDTDANPTTPTVGAGLMLFNGTSWFRLRGDLGNGMDVDITRMPDEGQQTMAGSISVAIASDQSTLPVETELPAAAALADGAANPTTPMVGANAMLFNGSTWDRMRGDITNGLRADVTRVQAFPAVTTASGSLTAPGHVVSIPIDNGRSGLGVQVTGTWTGQLECEVTIDGSTWVEHDLVNTVTCLVGNSITSNGIFIGSLAGYTTFRVRASALSSGTAVVNVRLSTGIETVSLESPIPAGASAIGDVGLTPRPARLTSVSVSFATSGNNTVVAGVGGQSIRVYRLFFLVNQKNTLIFRDGASTDLTGPMDMGDFGDFTLPFDTEPWFTLSTGNAFIINTSNAKQVSGRVYYTIG